MPATQKTAVQPPPPGVPRSTPHVTDRVTIAVQSKLDRRRRPLEEHSEVLRLLADLPRLNRITTMGQLTAAVAHEVSQPIAAALVDATTCLRWLTCNDPDLEAAREAAQRVIRDMACASEIVSHIRGLFKNSGPRTELVDVGELITETVALVRSEAVRYGISIDVGLADLEPIIGDRIELQQVLLNLMLNAIQATQNVEGKREISVTARPDHGDRLLVTVSDSGVGLPVNADEIFEAFVTTKPDGTGVGLAICRSIIESHDGEFWAISNADRGATFCFRVPTRSRRSLSKLLYAGSNAHSAALVESTREQKSQTASARWWHSPACG